MLSRLMIAMAFSVVVHAQGTASFADPELLLANGRPMNAVEKMPYPSPVLFDIDGDGKREFVLGDLWGRLWIHENVGAEGPVKWGPSQTLKREGKDLKVPNW